MAKQDPTWDCVTLGRRGQPVDPHVYMPAQNPGDPSGMSAFGRWMYGPWFWPPAKDAKYPPIANPYYDPSCDLDDSKTWQYQTRRSASREIPATPNISVGMEAFNDTPIVNGTAYPTTTVDPKAYRYRILNAANDRFWNLSWYVADPTTGTLSEVALKPAEVAAAQTDPNVFPTPDTTKSPAGPNWIQIGTEGGFLPAPVVVPNQPITWITDPTRFDVGNVDQHSLLLAPAERADVDRRLLAVPRQDPDPLQRRTGGVPGPRPRLRLLHRRPRPDAGRRADAPCPATARTPARSCRSRCRRKRRQSLDGRTRPTAGRLVRRSQHHADGSRRLRVRPGPDHRRPGRLQLGLRHELRRAAAAATARPDHDQVRRVRADRPAGRRSSSSSTP